MKEILITSSVLIAALLLLRLIFAQKVRRTIIYAAWALVALRLLIPVQIGEMNFSVLTAAKPLTETVAGIEELRIIGQNEREAEIQVTKDYIRQDVTVFTPEVQEYIRQEQAANTPAEEIASALVKTQGSEAFVPEVQQQVQQQVAEKTNFVSIGQLATVVWLLGVAGMAVWFLFVNLRHGRKLRQHREELKCESPIPVFVSDQVGSPCLVGLFRPVIYLTPESAANAEIRRHVLTHELTHYAHKDHIWSVVRCVCLCVYWFDPLVWAAAWCSRRDCELACDEGALKRLGENERIAYGKTLLEVVRHASAPAHLMQTATSMNETKEQLKQRVNFIVKKPKWSIIAAVCMVLVCAIVAGCAMTGAAAKGMERSVEVNYHLEDKICQRGENVRITVAVKNTGCEIPYTGADADQFVPAKLSAEGYEISSVVLGTTTTDATERVFHYGETMTYSYIFEIPHDAVLGAYDLQIKIFGVDVLLNQVMVVEGDSSAESTGPTSPETATKWVYLTETIHEEIVGAHPDETTVFHYDANGYTTGYDRYRGERLDMTRTVECFREERVLKVLSGGGALWCEYTFDEEGNLLSLTRYGSQLVKWEYTYDAGKLIRELQLTYQQENDFSYKLYDIQDIRYTYDAQGKQVARHTYEYYADTPEAMIELYLRGYELYSYGTDGRCSRVENYSAYGELQSYSEYTYDDENRTQIIKIYGSHGRGDNLSWEIDQICTTSYDEAGNVIREEVQEDVWLGDGRVTVTTYTYIQKEVPLDYFAPEL